MKNYNKEIVELRKLHREASLYANKIFKEMARDILKDHNDYKEFVMAMGSAFFVNKNNINHSIYHNDKKYMERLRDFLDEFDEVYHITGEPVRFTKDGEEIHDW